MESQIVEREAEVVAVPATVTIEDRIDIIDDAMRKKYLARLSDMDVVPIGDLPSLEEDLIDNVRLYRIDEMVYQKGESVTDKFTTVFNTLATYNASVFVLVDSNGKETRFYLGVRNNDPDESPTKRSTVTLGDTLSQTLVGHFPGVRLKGEDRQSIAVLSQKMSSLGSVASVSVVGNTKAEGATVNERFVQGLEKLVLAMSGRAYTGILIADNQSPQDVQLIRKQYQDLYTKLSPFRQTQFSESKSSSTSRSKSFAEMDGKQKAAMIAASAVSLAGVVGGAVAGGVVGQDMSLVTTGSMVGGQIAGQLGGFINSLAPVEQLSTSESQTVSTTTENKAVTDMLSLLDELIKKTDEYDSYGLWHVAGYFLSDDMASAEIAASNYRSLMNGERSGREVSAINSWRSYGSADPIGFQSLTTYLSRFVHPQFSYGGGVVVDASTSVSGKELGLHLGLPRATVPGLPVVEHAEFGKEVTSYQLIPEPRAVAPEDRITIGKIFDLGHVTDKIVELDNRSLNMHTFVTGSTGSGKSNAVYQMLAELRQDKIPFLVVEPAKGEYKDAFGNLPDVSVYSTNPNVARLVNLNPFMFPESIHVLEHVDGLVEIFGVCWPMYDAMPAFFKDAILRSYEAVGWDLGSSTHEGVELEYPDFEILAEQLDELIGSSDYASDIKSNYRGALLTRVRSLTVGLNKYIFTSEQTPYEELFDKNCVLDISRVKSGETKALIMGLVVYALNEYRVDQKTGNNNGLRHVTVLEEAHNLLKNTIGGASELVGKSVEMITNTIAEIRTYGEGFIIVDQSPSSVDIAAIKNTNTKIILRTPEANDRMAVGRSVGLTDPQVDEIAKLPSGVAVVYQNNWISPVLAMIDKANVNERPYEPGDLPRLMTVRSARTMITCMLLQPWLNNKTIRHDALLAAQRVLELKRRSRIRIKSLIESYAMRDGQLVWREDELVELSGLLKDVLDVTDAQLELVTTTNELNELVTQRLGGFGSEGIEAVCRMLSLDAGPVGNKHMLSVSGVSSSAASSTKAAISEEELRYVNACVYNPFYLERDSGISFEECIGKLDCSDALKALLVEYSKKPMNARKDLYRQVAYSYFGVSKLVRSFNGSTDNWDVALQTHVLNRFDFDYEVEFGLDSTEWIRFSQMMLAEGMLWIQQQYSDPKKSELMDALWKQRRIA